MWDPATYLTYGDMRGRPYVELLSRIACEHPRRVVDLGCGAGNLTPMLAKRWPDAVVEASDSSPEMVEASRAAGVDAVVLDARDWRPAPDTDVVITNAMLQWVPEHRDLLRRWVDELAPGSWLAVQVPGNFGAPSHRLLREVATTPAWRERLDGLGLRDADTVDEPVDYADLLSDAGCAVDVWETTYVQGLTGEDPVLTWMTGTALAPIKAALPAPDWERFRDDLRAGLDEAYPRRADGTTWFPFRRIFAVAQVGSGS